MELVELVNQMNQSFGEALEKIEEGSVFTSAGEEGEILSLFIASCPPV